MLLEVLNKVVFLILDIYKFQVYFQNLFQVLFELKEMNKKELVAYAKEKYNLELPEEMKKDDMLAAITKEMEKEEADNEDKDDSK